MKKEIIRFIVLRFTISLFLIVFLFLEANCQSYIIGNKSFKTTSTFQLYEIKDNFSSGKMRTNPINIAIGIDGKTGIVIISKPTFSTQERLAGDLYIYLDDNSVIKCIDRGNNDNSSNVMSKAYFLNEKELLMLLNSNINGMRYSTRFMQSSLENYTVYNADFEEKLHLMLDPKFYPRVNFPFELSKIR